MDARARPFGRPGIDAVEILVFSVMPAQPTFVSFRPGSVG
jgi:hypothetical protein